MRPEPVSYSELPSLLMNHEFIHVSSMSSLSLTSTDTSQIQQPMFLSVPSMVIDKTLAITTITFKEVAADHIVVAVININVLVW